MSNPHEESSIVREASRPRRWSFSLARSFGMYLISHQEDYGVEYNNKVTNAQGRRVWGYWGIKPLVTSSP